jgi:chitinase
LQTAVIPTTVLVAVFHGTRGVAKIHAGDTHEPRKECRFGPTFASVPRRAALERRMFMTCSTAKEQCLRPHPGIRVPTFQFAEVDGVRNQRMERHGMSSFLRVRSCTVALLGLFVLVACTAQSVAQDRHQGKIFGAYFEEWNIHYSGHNIADIEKNGVANELTHLLYAFGNVTTAPTPTCAIADPVDAYQNTAIPSVSGKPYTAPIYGNYGAILQLKQLHPRLKVLISLGGQLGDASGWVRAASTAAGRASLVSSCVELFVKGNIAPGVQAPGLFDGFNVDWEFPSAADKENFTALLKEFRTQLDTLSKSAGKTYVLSFDSPAGAKNYVNIDLKAAAAQVDFLTIDGYDYAGTWDKQTNEQSPLYDSTDNPLRDQGFSIDETVKAYLKAGVPAAKYTMGLPLYAVGWTGVPSANHGLYQNSTALSPVLLADGSGLCPNANPAAPAPGCDSLLAPGFLTSATVENLINKNGYIAWSDPVRVGATLYNPATGTFYSFDDPASVAVKTAYIKKNKLGGAYVWALNHDDAQGTLTKAIAAGLK